MGIFIRLMRHPVATFAVAAALIALSVGPVRNMHTETSLENMLDPQDQGLIDQRFLEERFGREDLLVLGIDGVDVFSLPIMQAIWEISEECSRLGEVKQMYSLTHAVLAFSNADEIEVRPGFASRPETQEQVDAFREKVKGTPLVIGNLVSKDLRTTSVNVITDIPDGADTRLVVFVDQVNRIARKHLPSGVEFCIAGKPALQYKLTTNIAKNFQTFAPLCLLTMGFFLVIIYRTWYGVFLTVFSCAAAMMITLAVQVQSGFGVDILTTMLPPLLLVIGTTTVIHIMSHYREEKEFEPDKIVALQKTIRTIGVPCFMATFTTCIGFVSLATNDIVPIQTFGIFTSVGIGLTFFVAMTLVPGFLSKVKPLKLLNHTGGFQLVRRPLAALASLNARHPWPVIVAFLTVTGAGIYGMTLIKVETHFLTYYYESDPFRKGFEMIERNLAGTTTLEVIFQSEEENGMITPEHLADIDRFERYLIDTFPEVGKTTSVCSYLREMNRAMNNGSAEFDRLPESIQGASQLLLLYSMSEEDPTRHYLSEDRSLARVQGRIRLASSNRLSEIATMARDYLEKNASKDLTLRVSGTGILFANMANMLVSGQIRSFGLAAVLISLCVVLLFRSPKLGLLAMIPNISPIFITFGLMGFCGIALNTATSMIAGVAMGIAVDDTIHFLSRYLREVARDGNPEEAMRRSLMTIGQAMVFTTVVITSGFMVLTMSDHIPFVYFGLLTSITMVTALGADLLLFPALLVALKVRK